MTFVRKNKKVLRKVLTKLLNLYSYLVIQREFFSTEKGE